MRLGKLIIYSLLLGCLFSVSANAQGVSPRDIKAARNAVYEWINNYNVYAKCTGRNAQSQFYSLFVDKDVEIYNDYFPMSNYNFSNPVISVEDYVKLLRSNTSFYEMKYEVKSATIQSEEYKAGKIIYRVAFYKNIWFVQRGNFEDDRYEYPNQELQLETELEFDIDQGKIAARSLSCDSPASQFVVFHDDGRNTIERINSLNSSCLAMSTQLVRYSMHPMDFDEKMMVMTSDTLKNYIGLGYTIGAESVKAPISDIRFSEYTITGGLQQSFWGSFYHQLSLERKHRWGVEVSLLYKGSSSNAEVKFNDRYDAVDMDGGPYERIIASKSYKEFVKRHLLEMPIAARYEYLYNKQLSLFAQAGVSLTYDIARTVEAEGEMEYIGYYDWLFNVTLAQNGIYDFGIFPLVQTSSDMGVNRFNMGGIISIGGCYYFLDNWMVELAFKYRGTLWGNVNKVDEYHLSRYDGDWTSISYVQDKYITNAFNFQLQVNYNF